MSGSNKLLHTKNCQDAKCDPHLVRVCPAGVITTICESQHVAQHLLSVPGLLIMFLHVTVGFHHAIPQAGGASVSRLGSNVTLQAGMLVLLSWALGTDCHITIARDQREVVFLPNDWCVCHLLDA